jgi:hypothetical protein
MRENHRDKLDTLLGQRRFHRANPDLAQRIILEAQRVRPVQRRLRNEKRNESHPPSIVKR